MSIDKFEDICQSGLFLANATKFDDKQEGYIAVKSTFPDLTESNLQNVDKMKSYFYISSWYAGEDVSKSMGNIYGDICIKTSLDELKAVCKEHGVINCTHNIILGEIQYLLKPYADHGKTPNWVWDYWSEIGFNPKCGLNPASIKTLQGLFFKDADYSHENEVRLICDTFHGRNRGIDIESRIEGIRITLSKTFFSNVVLLNKEYKLRVNNVLKKFGYESEIEIVE